MGCRERIIEKDKKIEKERRIEKEGRMIDVFSDSGIYMDEIPCRLKPIDHRGSYSKSQ